MIQTLYTISKLQKIFIHIYKYTIKNKKNVILVKVYFITFTPYYLIIKQMNEGRLLLCTAYMPSVAYMALLASDNGCVTIERHETYHRQTMRNRCIIATANGIKTLSVPVVCPQGNHTMTGNVLIDYNQRWQTIHWRTIITAYNSSPYFIYYKDDIEKILMHKHERLIDLNLALTEHLAKKLKISCSMIFSSIFLQPDGSGDDYRDAINKRGECNLFHYPEYHQVFGENNDFLPNLSILDLLFNLGPEARSYIISLCKQRLS